MEYALPITLLVVSLGLIVIEVFVPSFGVLTLGAVGCLIGAVWMAFQETSGFGWSLVGVAAVGVPIVLVVSFKLFPNTPLGKHMILAGPKSRKAAPARSGRSDLVGKLGRASSDLRPSGTAKFDGERLDVVTRGELIEAGSEIEVIENRGNRIIVKMTAAPEPEEEEEELR